jgi:hypothetical protein
LYFAVSYKVFGKNYYFKNVFDILYFQYFLQVFYTTLGPVENMGGMNQCRKHLPIYGGWGHSFAADKELPRTRRVRR